MRIKVIFDEKKMSLGINCLKDKDNTEIIMPENPDQHVYFPVPPKLTNELQKELDKLINPEESAEFVKLIEDIKELNKVRRIKLNEIRKRMNVEIMETCEKFQLDHAEKYI